MLGQISIFKILAFALLIGQFTGFAIHVHADDDAAATSAQTTKKKSKRKTHIAKSKREKAEKLPNAQATPNDWATPPQQTQ